jgi:hypothetical protein
MTRPDRTEREVARALAEASDTALTRAVALLDSLPVRDAAGRLLERVRPRLRRLRLPRPLTLTRLLFLPLAGAIVPPPAWRREPDRLPRTALQPLAGALREAGGAELLALETALAGHSFEAEEVVGELGRPLWALAARALPEATPPGWAEATGLGPGDHLAFARLCRGVWRHAGPLWEAMAEAEAGPPEELARAALAGPAGEAAPVLAACLATLMERAAMPARLAGVAANLAPGAKAIADRALDALIEASQPVLDASDPAGAAERAARLVSVLADLEAPGAGQAADRRERVQRLRVAADLACRAAFAEGLAGGLLGTAARLAECATDREVASLEDAARGLKRLEASGRRLGGDEAYDRALRAAEARLLALQGAEAGLTRMDRARLAEILLGRDAARAILDGR